MLWSGCSLQPLQQRSIPDLGYFEYRKSQSPSAGIVVGVPHGFTEPAAMEYAADFSAHTGAGLVAAYGFASKRLPVSQPLVRSIPVYSGGRDPRRGGSIYPEFKSLLQTAATGRLRVYLGVRMVDAAANLDRIEMATTGLSHEQLQALAQSFAMIRDKAIEDTGAPVVDLTLDPIDEITWQVSGVKHHGVLMLAERGLSMRLPAVLAADPAKRVYRKILSQWAVAALDMIRNNPGRLRKTEITVLEFGKVEVIPGNREPQGIVIGAPHGTYDVYTAGIVRTICSRARLPGVIATGFTPTETGDGRRINVNRPTERYVSGDREFETERAKLTYAQFKTAVLGAARTKLDLYIDIHQNGGERIEVATVAVSKERARMIKKTFHLLRDQALAAHPEIRRVDLAIEPLDQLEVGAWAAKTNGILTAAKRSLHFELPANVLASARHRAVYTNVLTELVQKIVSQR